ncbi:MAG: Rab family GTPase, partial [Candidatus Thorarchaeota archaeon]
MADEYDYLFKSIVVGDGGVGKTALTLRFSKGFFTEDYKMTIGVDFHVKTIKIDTEEEGQILVKLQIWDTGGQERFSSIRPMYYRGALGALLIFDLTSDESFEHLPQWIEEVRANVKSEVPLLLVGNKSDLVDLRAVSLDVINDFTEKFNLYYMETSAKTGEGVGDCFYILACLMVGSGVPDLLISKGIVFSPGDVLAAAGPLASTPMPQEKPAVKVSVPSLEPEPEIEFAAP